MKLDKSYDPKQYEEQIYKLWEEQGVFTPEKASHKDSYSIVVPPPNANGDLHLGHGLTLAIEDIAVRYQRLQGKQALLLPGADHAGFETQVVYERQLAKEGKSRFDFSREELYSQIWDFVASNKEKYQAQFRQLGAGVDWTHYTYTLDEKITRQAYATFKKMWDEGLIYRGERLVNFCTFHGTAFADIEVAYKEEKGNLWYIKYPLTDGSGEVIVATTRPETMLGDTAVAVHPDDERFKAYIGKTIKLPLTHREIPIIADDFVEREYGTGAVKITPAHDPNDFDVAGRHDLPMMTVIDHEGKMTHDVPEAYRGLPVNEAREAVVKDLEKQGFLDKTEELSHSVGHCYKCDTVIEPLLRDQWFIDMKPLAEPAIKALKDNEIKFYPENKKDQLITYLEGLRDWNISRQIAWGIPIPAFQNVDDSDDWIFDERSEPEIVVNGQTYRRDPDVFDTWFSSSSWPYATLDYPNGEDFHQFYPLSVMETGADILYPWVSRMIMFGLYVTGEVPFEKVYLHGLILDEKGAKMSKSKGNVINPIDVVEEFGSDALRIGIIADESPASRRPFDRSKVVGARNFCNKLWNIARFIGEKVGEERPEEKPKAHTMADHWMLNNLQQSYDQVAKYLDDYRFSEAYEAVYETIWHDVADWYIEASKKTPNLPLLAFVLEASLKLAHPFAPFVTEAIWQSLEWDKGSLLAASTWPEIPHHDKKDAADFDKIITIVTEIRYITSSLEMSKPVLYFSDSDFLTENGELLATLARLGGCKQVADGHGLNLTSTPDKAWLDVDMGAAHSFVKKLENKVSDYEMSVKRLEGRLSNEGYVKNAPKEVVDQTKDQLEQEQKLLGKVSEELQRFRGALAN